jgi:hypothetical protein
VRKACLVEQHAQDIRGGNPRVWAPGVLPSNCVSLDVPLDRPAPVPLDGSRFHAKHNIRMPDTNEPRAERFPVVGGSRA